MKTYRLLACLLLVGIVAAATAAAPQQRQVLRAPGGALALSKLASEDASERHALENRLIQQGAAALPALFDAYAVGSPKVSDEARAALLRVVQRWTGTPSRGDEIAAALPRYLEPDQPLVVRRLALILIGLAGRAETVPQVARLLGDADLGEPARQALMRLPAALDAYLRVADALSKVEALLEGQPTRVFHAALEAYIAIGGQLAQGNRREAAVAVLTKALDLLAGQDRALAVGRQLRQLGVATDLTTRQGFVSHWWIIGPFPSPDAAAFDTAYFPEHEIELDKEYEQDGRVLRWRHHATEGDGIIWFDRLFHPKDNVCAYGYAEVTVQQAQEVLFKIGSDDDVVCWLNGRRIHANRVGRGLKVDDDVVQARLEAGANHILLKVLNHKKDWAACLRITDPNGRPIRFEAGVAHSVLALPATAGQRQPLFNGRDLSGWHQVGGEKWTVRNGEIVGETGDGRYGWLVTDREYRDFVLDLRFKTEAPGNSGVQFRSHVCGGRMKGYQAEVSPARGHNTGGVWEEARERGWLAQPPKSLDDVLKEGEWNHYRISAIGTRIATYLNGVKMVEFDDERAVLGIIALQVHSGDVPVRVRWKDIHIQDLGYGSGWVPLFNGRDLTGWKVHGKEKWRVEHGTIVGESSAGGSGYLATDKTYRDFVLRAKFKCEANGNSSLFFRATVADSSILGVQAEVDPTPRNLTAGLHASGGRGWLAEPNADARKLMRSHGWNEIWVTCKGNRTVTHLNGFEAVVFDDPEPRFTEGVIALQVHNGGGVKVRWKDLYIKPLPQHTGKP